MNKNRQQAKVSAAANIALIKYWGKRETTGNQPATASLSIGLEDLRTTTAIGFSEDEQHHFSSDLPDSGIARMSQFLDLVRHEFEIKPWFNIETANNFPTGTGLASSASGFAALAMGIDALLNLQLGKTELSRLARKGSGSAARSVFGGYAEIVPADDAYALSIMPAAEWPLDVIVAITDENEKTVGSTDAMKRTADTSPFYKDWLRTHTEDMTTARLAISNRDFDQLADISEHNCLKMHATMSTSRPPVIYWLPATMAVISEIQSLRNQGTAAFFTIDAGPQVKIICEPGVTDHVEATVKNITGVVRTIRTRVGGEPKITIE